VCGIAIQNYRDLIIWTDCSWAKDAIMVARSTEEARECFFVLDSTVFVFLSSSRRVVTVFHPLVHLPKWSENPFVFHWAASPVHIEWLGPRPRDTKKSSLCSFLTVTNQVQRTSGSMVGNHVLNVVDRSINLLFLTGRFTPFHVTASQWKVVTLEGQVLSFSLWPLP
jgi:hypothetical protein